MYFILILILLINNHQSQSLIKSLVNHNESCKTNDYKYDFTECDELGGKWRVMVPSTNCKIESPLTYVPKRIDNCYTSCDGGQFFNKSSLLCENCQPGHYSLNDGGIIFDNFQQQQNNNNGLPDGFVIRNEYRGHMGDVVGDGDHCSGWHVDNRTGYIELRLNLKETTTTTTINSGCISILTYTAKIVKQHGGRLRFKYRYKQSTNNPWPLSLLFTFNYRLYDNLNIDDNVIDDTNIKFPIMNNNDETIQLSLKTPGLYTFQWKAIVIKNFHNYFTNTNDADDYNNNNNNNNRFEPHSSTSIATIRIKMIIIEGVAFTSECTPCPAGTYAPESGMKECLLCPANTAINKSGAIQCMKCDSINEYSSIGSTTCLKRPTCGLNDLFIAMKTECDPITHQQTLEYRWIEPRICVDSDGIFERYHHKIVNNCTVTIVNVNECDVGMEMNRTNNRCQFCNDGYYRNKNMTECQPCSPMTIPYYAIHIQHWNNSLPGWQSFDNQFDDDPSYLNYYFNRQCYSGDNDDDDDDDQKADESCQSSIAWQTFDSYIRTAPSTPLNSYLILSLSIPYFRSSPAILSFEFEMDCPHDDECQLLFVETRSEIYQESDNDWKRIKYIDDHQSINRVIKLWRKSINNEVFRYEITNNISITFSWIFKRTKSFKSYVKIHWLSLIGSSIGSAIRCDNCNINSSFNQCIKCSKGEYLKSTTDGYRCEKCAKNFILSSTDEGKKCIACEENLHSDLDHSDYCYNDCLVEFIDDNNQSYQYDLKQLSNGPRIIYKGLNLFTSGGTQYMNVFNITLCGNRKQRDSLSHCIDNITSSQQQSNGGIRSYICRSTIIPDDGDGIDNGGMRKVFAAQSASLGDQIVAITRRNSFENISIPEEFLNDSMANKYDKDYHIYYRTANTNSKTNACLNGRTFTITMRCIPGLQSSLNTMIVKTLKSCPYGTCNGCDFHLLIETSTAAACHFCRQPYSVEDFETIIMGECIDGEQLIHYINAKNCIMKTTNITSSFIQKKPCSLLIPKQIQIGIVMAIISGIVLLMLVFYFWNKNRSLEFKYTKLIENDKINNNRIGNDLVQDDEDDQDDDDDDDVRMDNCCVDEHDSKPINDEQQNVELQRLFSINDKDKDKKIDDDGYETIHLISADNDKIPKCSQKKTCATKTTTTTTTIMTKCDKYGQKGINNNNNNNKDLSQIKKLMGSLFFISIFHMHNNNNKS